jgi:hypothetical protein
MEEPLACFHLNLQSDRFQTCLEYPDLLTPGGGGDCVYFRFVKLNRIPELLLLSPYQKHVICKAGLPGPAAFW